MAPPDGFYLTDGAVPGPEGATVSTSEAVRFKAMEFIHRALFEEGAPGARAFGGVLSRLDGRKGFGGALLAAARATKGPAVGCVACGSCQLPATAHVCPETCPKGLANGPCGGTIENRCEFGDRECIHNQIYRISKQNGRLADLEDVLIPAVPDAAWGQCSWVTHFKAEGPQTIRLATRAK